MKLLLFFLMFFLSSTHAKNTLETQYNMPEIYQDILIQNNVVEKGIRECGNRYQAIRPILDLLPKNFKSLDIGASQGYFSFRMAEDYNARCTLIEEGYTTSESTWHTGRLLHHLCTRNKHLNLTLLQKKFYYSDFLTLKNDESFDLVIAFSVIHHMRKPNEPFSVYKQVIESIINLAPIVLIENPINTGDHTQYIRQFLQKKKGILIHTSKRGTLIYEIYLFKNNNLNYRQSLLPDITLKTYKKYEGTFSTVKMNYNE